MWVVRGGGDGQKYADRSNLLLAITHSSHRSYTNDPQRHMMMCKPRDQRNHSINGTKGIINMAETVRISHFIRFRHSLLSGPLHNLSIICIICICRDQDIILNSTNVHCAFLFFFN